MKYQQALVMLLLVSLGLSHYLGYTPLALVAIFALSSAISYGLYWKDKAAAVNGTWRVPERTLHVAALLFGWPGALLAQERLRHKTRKRSFRIVFWLTVLVNLGGLAWLHCPLGNSQLRALSYEFAQLAASHVPYKAPAAAVVFLTDFR